MALRGTTPKDRKQRLKLLLSGEAGVGKTTACIQMPRPYLIDTEQGSVHYGGMIEKAGGAVFESQNVDDIINEVKSLMSEDHNFLTVVIDPITTVFNDTLDDAEKRVGSEFGRHYGEANKKFKRLCNLLTAIDMNVVVTAHEKNEYAPGGKMEIIGKTFDGYKKLDYIFDLWLQLSRNRGQKERQAFVAKTRLSEFPDGDSFPWKYSELVNRYGKERLEKGVETVELATPEQVERLDYLLSQLSDEQKKSLGIDKALKDVDDLSDLHSDRAQKAIDFIEQSRKPQNAA